MTAPTRPPVPGIPDSTLLRQELRRIGDIIFRARSTVSEGILPRLGDLERMIRTACTSVQMLASEDAGRLRPMMEALLYDLDALETDMRNRFGDLALRSDTPPGNGSSTHAVTVGAAYRQAQKLYGTASGQTRTRIDPPVSRQGDPAPRAVRPV